MTFQTKVLSDFPKGVPAATGGLHPETKRIIVQLKSTKGRVLSCTIRNAHQAKIRLDALRRARKRGTVKYKEARRSGNTLYFKVR